MKGTLEVTDLFRGVYILPSGGNLVEIRVKKGGKGYVCRCPFPDHEDKTPSFVVTPSENLWNCFGCNRGGDIFKFDELYFNLDFAASVKKHETAPPLGAVSKKSI